MKAKSDLKAVESENLKQAFEHSQHMTDISAHLYLAKSILSVIAGMDTNSPDAFDHGDVQYLALEGKIRIDAALELLNP